MIFSIIDKTSVTASFSYKDKLKRPFCGTFNFCRVELVESEIFRLRLGNIRLLYKVKI